MVARQAMPAASRKDRTGQNIIPQADLNARRKNSPSAKRSPKSNQFRNEPVSLGSSRENSLDCRMGMNRNGTERPNCKPDRYLISPDVSQIPRRFAPPSIHKGIVNRARKSDDARGGNECFQRRIARMYPQLKKIPK
jgi:hypothetical protein